MLRPAADTLLSAYRRGRLSHAIILYGPEKVALEATARQIVSTILGLRNAEPPLLHPDLFSLQPANKMRQISVAAIRDLIRNLSQSSNQGGAKVALIADAERMNQEAANALLKSLEEPPPDTYLFLTSTRLGDFLDTIRSRCLLVHVGGLLGPIPDPEWRDWIQGFHSWLTELDAPLTKKTEVSSRMLGAYGLIRKFLKVEDRLASAEWKEFVETVPAETSPEALAALEAGTTKGMRQRLLGEIADALVEDSRKLTQAPPEEQGAAVIRLQRAVTALEESSRLLALNFNATAALENFFLKVLRSWSIRAR
ncbi:MAG: hypothetical protein ACFCU4_11480 [Puniceicoccaceae bacterium]